MIRSREFFQIIKLLSEMASKENGQHIGSN